MNKTLLALFCMGFSTLIAQTDYPKGCYMTTEDLRLKSPSSQIEGQVVERTNGDINMNGGNRYKILPPDDEIKKKHFKRDTYVYSDGVHLFVNCKRVGHQNWYAKVETEGRFLVFYCQVPNGDIVMAGVAGGLIATSIVAGKGALVAIDSETGRSVRLNRTVVQTLLRPFPELYERYIAMKPKDQRNLDIVFSYMIELNEVYASKEAQSGPVDQKQSDSEESTDSSEEEDNEPFENKKE